MTHEQYLSYIDGVINSYSTKEKEYLKKLFIDKLIAYEDLQLKIDPISETLTDPINIANLELHDKINKCIHTNNQAVRIFEEWEFTKHYKYSVIYTTNVALDELNLNIKNNSAILKKDEISEYAHMFDIKYMFDIKPLFKEDDNFLFLKYNLKFEAIHPQTQEELLIKYPLLAVIHKKENLIELRFDDLKKIFIYGRDKFYFELATKITEYFKTIFNANITPLDLDFMISKSQNNEKTKLIAQYIKTVSGGHAKLSVGDNEKYILPFIGELNLLMQENKSEFDKSPIIKELLEQFILEKEEMSDYPWIVVLWENEIKTRSFQVKFVFNYMNGNFCLIQHYHNYLLLGMERMNNVVRFIGENRGNCPKTI